jgi:hypothetical protein
MGVYLLNEETCSLNEQNITVILCFVNHSFPNQLMGHFVGYYKKKSSVSENVSKMFRKILLPQKNYFTASEKYFSATEKKIMPGKNIFCKRKNLRNILLRQ